MNAVIKAIRQKYPEYADVSDSNLTLAIGQKYPEYLDVDDFRAEFEPLAAKLVVANTETMARPFGTSTTTGGPPLQLPSGAMQATMENVVEEATRPPVELPRFQEREGQSGLESLAKGAANVGAGFAEFMTSPAGLAVTATGPVGHALGTVWGAATVPEVAQQAGEASVTGTPQEKVEAYGTLGLIGGGTALGASKVGIQIGRNIELRSLTPAQRVVALEIERSLNRPLGIIEDVDATARANLSQRAGEVQQPFVPEAPGQATPTPEPMGTFRQVQANAPKGERLAVPETAPEPERGLTVLQEIRQKGARTKEQIRGIFPQLNREQAAELRRLAWPDDPMNQPKAPPVPPKIVEGIGAALQSGDMQAVKKLAQQIPEEFTGVSESVFDLGRLDAVAPKTAEALRSVTEQPKKGVPDEVQETVQGRAEEVAPAEIKSPPVESGATPRAETPLTETASSKVTGEVAASPPSDVGQATPEPAKAQPTAKEPWEMTRQQVISAMRVGPQPGRVEVGDTVAVGMDTKRPRIEIAEDFHRRYIKGAIKSGERISPAVLADYPDLKPAPEPTKPAEAAPEAKAAEKPTDVHAQEVASGTTYQYRIVKDGDMYRAQMRMARSDGTFTEWEGPIGVGAGRDRANVAFRFAERYPNAEMFDPDFIAGKKQVEEYTAQREQEAKAKQDELNRISEIRSQYDAEVNAVELPKGKKQDIKIRATDESGKVISQSVPATVHGYMAIRPSGNVKYGSKYILTHVPSGLGIGNEITFQTLGQVKQVIKALIHTGVDLSKKSFTNEELSRLAAAKNSLKEGGTTPEFFKPQPPKSSEPMSPGPGAAAKGTPGTDKAQIEQLTDAFKNIEGKKVSLGQKVKDAFDAGTKTTQAKDAVSRAVAGLKSVGDFLKQKITSFTSVDDMMRAKGDLSAELEKRGWRVREFVSIVKKAMPDKRQRAAVAKYVDAGGDRAVLEQGLAEAPDRYKQAYQDALDLSGDALTAADNIRNYFEARLEEAIDAGVLEHGVTDYIHRIYENNPKARDHALAYVQSGILSKNPALAKKRVFQFDWEAEKQGFNPVQDFIPRIAQYESSLSKAIAAREFIKKATTMKAADGRPVIGVKGIGIPVENAEGVREATLIKPDINPKAEAGTKEYRGDYVNREYPALSKWKWVATDAADQPIYLQSDVAIHPDYVRRVDALLEPSRRKAGKITGPMLKIGATVKQTMLDLSFFHQVQIAVHAAEHRVMPWSVLRDINFEDPAVDGLLRGGVTLGGDYYSPQMSEGLIGRSLTRHVPGLGPLMESYHSWLFQSFIPRVKMTMALHALERNKIRYAKDLKSGKMNEESLYRLTAEQANAAFGELNYITLERSKTAQDTARIIMLAPDFLEARARFAGQALTKYGTEQRVALLLGALTMWTLARIANKAINDQYHFEPENLFNIVYNGRTYGLRTVQGDILHLIDKPVQFWINRLNPVWGRTTLEAATGRDYFGRKRSFTEQVWDLVNTTVPISLRTSRERTLWESMMNSLGVTARRWNDVDDAFKLARKWKEKNGIGEKGEFIYDGDKDPLRPLKIALSFGDEAGAVAEIKALMESGKMKRLKLNEYFDRYANMPFTGSRANDVKWMKTLSEDEKKTVEGARQHKRNMRNLYRKARDQYDQAKNNPNPQ